MKRAFRTGDDQKSRLNRRPEGQAQGDFNRHTAFRPLEEARIRRPELQACGFQAPGDIERQGHQRLGVEDLEGRRGGGRQVKVVPVGRGHEGHQPILVEGPAPGTDRPVVERRAAFAAETEGQSSASDTMPFASSRFISPQRRFSRASRAPIS